MPEVTLATIEAAAREYSGAHGALAAIVAELNEDLDAVKRKHVKAIRRAVAAAAEEHAKLENLVDSARHLFTRPRTVVFHGIKVGLRKGTGGIYWDDPDKVVALVKRHFNEWAELLISTTEKPNKDGLEKLPVADLKKLGCTVEDDTDQVFIKPVDSDVDKAVAALLKDATEGTEEAS